MLIESIGKRRFAFGLDWIIQAGKPAVVLTEANVLPSDEPVFAAVVGRAPKKPKRRKKGEEAAALAEAAVPTAIGYVVSIDSLAGVIPAAAALVGQDDGLYVAQLSTGEWWFVGIQQHQVIAHTDRVDSFEAIKDILSQLRHGLNLTVYSASAADELGDVVPFDLDAMLRAGAKAPALRRVATGASPIIPLLVVAGVITLAFVGYRIVFPPAPKLTPAQQQQLARQQYIQSVRGVLGQLPVGPGWLARAYDKVIHEAPPYLAGWTLDHVDCALAPAASCKVTYKVAVNHPFALSPLNTRFGASAVVIGQDGHSAIVTLPVSVATIAVSEPMLRAVKPATMPLLDWVGALPLGMAGAKVDGQLLVRHLDQEFGAAAAGMPPLYLESVRIKAASFLDDLTLRPVLDQGRHGGFVPVGAEWNFGLDHTPASWNITWERIHG